VLDYIIVGQGIAGSMLSWHLLKERKKVLVVDQLNPSSSTRIAAGIINPITGRKFVKTWLADALIVEAEKTYAGFEKMFDTALYEHMPIVHLFDSVKSQNDWSLRCATGGYQHYLTNEQLVSFDKQKVKNDFGGFEINGGGRLNTDAFISHYRSFLQTENILLDETFDFDALQVQPEKVKYKQHEAARIIFCDGANAIHNPYFKFLPFQLAKGECLIVNIPNFYPNRIIKGEVAIMPYYGTNLYYIGATHAWHFNDDQPSDIGKNELLGNLSAILNCPFEIIEHKAAIRPTVKQRRPFLGFHPQFNNVGIFNGMGTKGVSLAPYFAVHLVQHMLHQTPLMPEVDIQKLKL
jgi:glycine/D-amino acid oxidase-like deaminating enzyme